MWMIEFSEMSEGVGKKYAVQGKKYHQSEKRNWKWYDREEKEQA